MRSKDHFSGHAADYASHRPTYPRELFECLAGLVPQRSLAWDCATGNGQAAGVLAEFFDRVVATDASAEQVRSAAGLADNVELHVAPAEASGIRDTTVDLVTVAQALHWFNFDSFYSEVRRVIAPGGVVAVWSYGLTRISEDVDAVIDQFYRGEIDAFWIARKLLFRPPLSGRLSAGEGGGAISWTSTPGTTYAIRYSSDLRNYAAEIDGSVPASAGDTTTESFILPVELIGIPRLYFRIQPSG